MIQKKKIWLSVVATFMLILLAVFLYIFTLHTVNKSFFDSSVAYSLETLQVIRDLGVQTVDSRLWDLKADLQNSARRNYDQLIKGDTGTCANILSGFRKLQDGIDYWYCTLDGKAVNQNGIISDWRTVPGLETVFNKREAAVLDPYFDEKGDYILVVAAPLIDDGQAAGVLLARLDGYCLSRWIGNIQYQTGYGSCYMIAGDGRNIAASREENYDWIRDQYNSQKIINPSEQDQSVAAVELLPLEGKSGWGSYQWEGSTNYVVYGPLQETNWGFFVGFYGDTMGEYIRGIASKSTASSQPFVLTLLVFMAILAVYANFNLRKEKIYTKELLRQKQEIEKQAEDLSVSEERFRVALERTSSIIFEYNLQTGNITNFQKTEEVVHYETSYKNLKDSLVLGGEVDEESIHLLEACLDGIRNGLPKNECTIRVFFPDGIAAWYRVSISSVLDHGQRPVRVIGILEDITKEKMAELDPLTGIFNKKVMTEKILGELQQMDEKDTCAFLMFDIDHFKQINDTYGHPAGDRVIMQIADILRNVFFHHAFVGRIGGDEFCVFCYGSPSPEKLRGTLDHARNLIRRQFVSGYESAPITYSCGIAYSEGRSKTFEMLYQEADAALYKAKNKGRNQYVFNIDDD